MSKRKYPCPDCKMGLFPLYIQEKNEHGKRTFKTTNMYWCANCKCYINGEMIK